MEDTHLTQSSRREQRWLKPGAPEFPVEGGLVRGSSVFLEA